MSTERRAGLASDLIECMKTAPQVRLCAPDGFTLLILTTDETAELRQILENAAKGQPSRVAKLRPAPPPR